MKFTSTTALFVISVASAATAAPFHNVPAYSTSTTQSSTCTEATVSSSTTAHSSLSLEQPSIIVLEDKPTTTLISKVRSTSASTASTTQRNPFELGTLHLGHGPVVISHVATSTSTKTSSSTQSTAVYTPDIIMHIETAVPIIIEPTQVLSSVSTIAYSHKDASSTSSIPYTVTDIYPSLHFGHGPAVVSPALVTSSATTSTVVSTESVSHSTSVSVPTTMITQTVEKPATASYKVDSTKSTKTDTATSTGSSSRGTKTIHHYITVSVVRDATKQTNY